MERIEDTLRLANVQGLGPKLYRRLRQALGTDAAILGASARTLTEVEGVGSKLAGQIGRAAEHDPRPELERAAELGVQILGQHDSRYPEALHSTFDPPIVLYVRGDLRRNDNIGLAVVGTRQASRYGRDQAERFGAALARAGFTVVSGLARGVDSAAHRGALAAQGRTLAVLGCGLATIYPEENRDLGSEIARSGALVSEFPLDTSPSRENFPRRNRIIAGLSLGTLVVEGPCRSGALITARFAADIGREVFAIPGRIDQRNAEGTNRLIAEGQAKLVDGLESILEELGPIADDLARKTAPPAPAAEGEEAPEQRRLLEDPPAAPEPPSQSREGRILAAIGEEEVHIDEICARCGLPVHEVSASLMMLELKRAVAQSPGKFFTRLRT